MFTATQLEEIEAQRRIFGPTLALLRGAGSLWRSESVDNLRAILASGAILPNVNGRFAPLWGEGYGSSINAVCLFDLDTASEDEIFLTAQSWRNFLTDIKPATVWIEIPRVRLDPSLVEPPFPRKGVQSPTGPTSRRIPYVEAWHCGPIAVSTFSRYLVFGKPGDSEMIEHCSVPAGPGAFEEITAIVTDWTQRIEARSVAFNKELAERSANEPPDPERAKKLGAADERLQRYQRSKNAPNNG